MLRVCRRPMAQPGHGSGGQLFVSAHVSLPRAVKGRARVCLGSVGCPTQAPNERHAQRSTGPGLLCINYFPAAPCSTHSTVRSKWAAGAGWARQTRTNGRGSPILRSTAPGVAPQSPSSFQSLLSLPPLVCDPKGVVEPGSTDVNVVLGCGNRGRGDRV